MPSLKITQKLLIYLILISILPLLILSVTSYTIASNTLLAEVQRYNQQVVSSESEQLDLILEQLKSLIFNLSGVQEIRETIEQENVANDDFTRLRTQARIGNILNGYSNVEGLVSVDIFTLAGAHYHYGDTLLVETIDEELQQNLFLQAQASPETIAWLGIENNVNLSSSSPQVVTAARIFTKLNRETMLPEPIALMLVTYSVDELYERLYNINLDSGVQLFIVDSDGLFVVHSDLAQVGATMDRNLLLEMQDSGRTFTSHYEGVDASISYQRSEVSGWWTVSVTPLSVLNAKSATIGITTSVLLLGSLIVVGIVASILNRSVVLPIRDITRRLDALQSDAPSPALYFDEKGHDEIGELKHGFNLLVKNQEEKRHVEAERLRLISELEIAKNQAEESVRLKSEFLSTMSHELRTPLNAIEGFTGIMLEGIGGINLDAKTHRMVERIAANSSRLLALINDFLDLSRIESGRIQITNRQISPKGMLDSWVTQMSVLAESKNLEFESSISPDFPQYIYGDEEAYSKIAINLLGNAFKFTKAGKVSVRMEASETYWTLTVQDTGIGIPPHATNFIFDEFRQVDQSSRREFGGTGLGLAIVKKLVRAIGATIQLQSEVNVGSSFVVTFPLIQETKELAQ